MRKLKILFSLALTGMAAIVGSPAQDAGTNIPAWLTRPLSLTDALNTALQQNAAILEARNDLEASHGVVVQTRAVALPQLKATGQYSDEELSLLQEIPVPDFSYPEPHQNWSAGIQIVQSIYMGGRMVAAFRAADATEKQALAVYQTSVADNLLNVRLAYYDVLLAAQEITVHEASVKLLEKELEDQQHRLNAGTVRDSTCSARRSPSPTNARI